MIDGWIAPGYEPVRRAFADNFRERGELGAAFAVYRAGEPVVDLWGGMADPARGVAWTGDSLQLVFSGAKGLVATCVLVLLERGALTLEDRVADHWPEFAAAGKAELRVRDLVAHTARLPGVSAPLRVEDIVDDRRMAGLLAAQPCATDPRAADCYHPLTFGWLVGELVRRVDGRSVGRFFAEEIARPLELEAWIGLPPEHLPRVTMLEPLADPELTGPPDPLWDQVWENPPLFHASSFPWNEPAFRTAEIPAVNAIATARSLARLYGCLALGGTLGDVALLSPSTVELGRTPISVRDDPLVELTVAFGVGFRLGTAAGEFGPVAPSFGHSGAGGSVHGAWPGRAVGFSYAMNRMREDAVDPRAAALLTALAEVTAAQPRG